MKKLILLLCLLGLASVSQAGQGGQYTTQPFINGQFLVVSNNTTIEPLLLQTNVFFIDNKNLGRWAFMNTNFVATTGQSGTNYIPAAFYWTNNQAFVQSNALAGGWTTNSQTINPPAILDVSGWADAYGSPSANAVISITAYGINSRGYQTGAPTNTCTFVFTKSANGTDFAPGGGTLNADYMTFAFAAPVATNYVFMTNVPTTFMQGARKIRLTQLTTSNVSSGTNIVFSDISLNGFVP